MIILKTCITLPYGFPTRYSEKTLSGPSYSEANPSFRDVMRRRALQNVNYKGKKEICIPGYTFALTSRKELEKKRGIIRGEQRGDAKRQVSLWILQLPTAECWRTCNASFVYFILSTGSHFCHSALFVSGVTHQYRWRATRFPDVEVSERRRDTNTKVHTILEMNHGTRWRSQSMHTSNIRAVGALLLVTTALYTLALPWRGMRAPASLLSRYPENRSPGVFWKQLARTSNGERAEKPEFENCGRHQARCSILIRQLPAAVSATFERKGSKKKGTKKHTIAREGHPGRSALASIF